MTNTTKTIVALVIAAVLAGGVFGGYKFLFSPAPQMLSGSTPVGSTFDSVKMAAVRFTPTNGATTTSIINPAGQDVMVTSNFVSCQSATTSYTAVTGAGLAALTFVAATTSTNAPASLSNTNYVMNNTIATGTTAAGTPGYGTILIASSSVVSQNTNAASSFQFLWPAATYMTFSSNATNTAACTVGVTYVGSN